jgi:hypothetical protein
VILTSNQSFTNWGEVFGDRVIATAILNRLLHHGITVTIRGDSYRLKEKIKAGDEKAIKAGMDSMMKLSEELYKHAQGAAGGASAGPGAGQQFHQNGADAAGPGDAAGGAKGKDGKDGAVDADFEVVK